jgi:putative ABC transport system permease protein
LEESVSDLGGEIMVWDESAFVPFLSTIPEDYTRTMQNISNVRNVVPQITGVSRIDSEDLRLTIGINPAYIHRLYTYTMIEGVMINNNDSSAAVGVLFADFLGKHVDQNITINDWELTVSGIYRTDTWIDNAVIVPFLIAQEIFSLEERTSVIILTVSDPVEIDMVISAIKKELPNVGVYKSQEAADRLAPLIDSITWISLALFAIAGIACFFGITNVVMTSVFERTREIGIMKALGAKGTDIVKIITYESAALGLFGGVLGCSISILLLGSGLLIPITSTTSIRIPVHPDIFLYGLGFSMAISILASLYPVWKAVRVRPNEVLRFG